MKILVISPRNKSLYNFRGDLIRDMIKNGHSVYATGPNIEDLDEVMKLGITDFYQIPFVKDNLSIKGDIHLFLGLKKIVQKVKPDIVFAYTIKPVIYGSIAAKMCGVKNINAMVAGLGRVFSSNDLKTRIVRKIVSVLYKTAFRCSNKVIFQNPNDRDQMVHHHLVSNNKTYIVNGSGVNMDRFTKADLPEKPIFMMVGRLVQSKGVLVYCEAARKLKQKLPQARFILLGAFDHSLDAVSEQKLQEFIDEGTIEHPGEVKDPVSYYHACSVFVLPSYYREGLPRTILEAMSCGRPIITTDWPGCREPINNGENGFLIPIKDVNALYERMKLLAEDASLRSKMGAISYRICSEKYDVRLVNQSMKEIIGY